jgi:hypothetical protein
VTGQISGRIVGDRLAQRSGLSNRVDSQKAVEVRNAYIDLIPVKARARADRLSDKRAQMFVAHEESKQRC